MFSILFPGQGSQKIGMASEFYNNLDYVKEYFSQADDILKKVRMHPKNKENYEKKEFKEKK